MCENVKICKVLTQNIIWKPPNCGLFLGKMYPRLVRGPLTLLYIFLLKERGGGQTFSISFWVRFRQVPLCRYEFKVIFDDIVIFTLGQYYRIYMLLTF